MPSHFSRLCVADVISSAFTCHNPANSAHTERAKFSHTLQVKVRRRGSDTKFVAQVLAVGTECDIGISVLSMHQGCCHRSLSPQSVVSILLACAPISPSIYLIFVAHCLQSEAPRLSSKAVSEKHVQQLWKQCMCLMWSALHCSDVDSG